MSLVEIYTVMRESGNSEAIRSAASSLEKLIEDPATFAQAIELISNSDPYLRLSASLLLEKLVARHWQKICASEAGAQVKQAILAAMGRERDVRTLKVLIKATEPICQIREVPWPELDQCAAELVQGSAPEQVFVGRLLFDRIVPYLDEGAVLEVLPMLCERFQAAVESKREDVIAAGCELVSTLATMFEPPIPDVLQECVVAMFRMLGSVDGITDSVLKVVKEDPVVSVDAELKTLVGLLESASDAHGAVQVILVLERMMDVNFDAMVNYLEQLVPLLLKAAELLWTEDPAEDQDAWTVGNIFAVICGNIGAEVYGDLFAKIQKASNERELFAGVVVHDAYIEEAPEVVVKNLQSFVGYLVECCRPTHCENVREAALGTLLKVVKVINGGLLEYRQIILDVLIPALEAVPDKALKTLELFLSVLPLDGKNTQPIMEAVMKLVLHGDADVRPLAVAAVSALILAAQDEVLPWAEQLLQLFQQAGKQVDDTELQIAGIIGLARLHAQNFEVNRDALSSSVALFVQAAQVGNTSVIGAVLSAFRTLVSTGVEMPPVMETLQVQIELALNILKKELHAVTIQLDDKSKALEEEYNEDARAKGEALDLITAISKVWPQTLASVVQDLARLSVDMMSLPHVQLTIIKFFTQLVVSYDLDANLGISTLGNMFEEDDPLVIGALFSAFGKLLEARKNIREDMLKKLVSVASQGICGKLPCQVEEELDIDLMRKLFKFFVVLAIHAPQLFPLNKYIAVVKHYDPDTETEFATTGVIPFPYLCRPGVPNVDSIAKGEMIRLLMGAVGMCRGTVSPDPIRAIHTLITDDFAACEPLLQQIFANLNEILQMTSAGQPTLTETKIAAVSLLFTLLQKMPQQFDAATYLPLMMSISPDDSPKDTAAIYASIVFLMENATSVMMQFAPQIVATIARTFGKRAQALKALKLPDDLRAKLIQLLKHLLSQLPNASDALREALGDNAALARLSALTSD